MENSAFDTKSMKNLANARQIKDKSGYEFSNVNWKVLEFKKKKKLIWRFIIALLRTETRKIAKFLKKCDNYLEFFYSKKKNYYITTK